MVKIFIELEICFSSPSSKRKKKIKIKKRFSFFFLSQNPIFHDQNFFCKKQFFGREKYGFGRKKAPFFLIIFFVWVIKKNFLMPIFYDKK